MRDNKTPDDYRSNAAKYLQETEGSYILDRSSGLYERHSKAECNEEKARGEFDIHKCEGLDARRPGWTQIAALLISLATLGGLFFTARYTYLQWQEARKTADAAISATDISAEALKLSRQEFSSSEAAVLEPKVSIRETGSGPFLQIDIINSGHISATHVNGKITATNHPAIQLTNLLVTDHSASPEYQTGFISRTIGLNSPLNLVALSSNHFRVVTELSYWNGTDQVSSKFCYQLMVGNYSNQEWLDCDNEKAFQQLCASAPC